MGLEHLSAVLQHAGRGGSHLLILLIIASYSDQHGEWTVHQATLQKNARLGCRRVQQVLEDLVAAGELAVVAPHGRGRHSKYKLLLGPANAQQSAPFPEKPAAPCTFTAGQPEPPCTFSAQKPEAPCMFTTQQSEPPFTFSVPPSPPFPPHPQSPLNPPERQTQETCGLPPAASQPHSAGLAPHLSPRALLSPLPGAGESDGRGARGEGPAVSPLPFGEGGSGTHGRGAGGEGVFRVNLLLEAAAVPLPTPAQIGLWSKTLGGIEPLLDLLRQLIEAGLATKRTPAAYVHRVVMERAAHPEPARHQPRRGHNPILAAGSDDTRREQARLIAAKRGGW